MQVTEDQKKAIGEWIQSGADLGKVQQSLKEEFELTLTYLDTRFLLADLGLEVQQEEEETDPEEPIVEEQDYSAKSSEEEPEAESEEEESLPEDPEEGTNNENQKTNVNLTVDSLTQPQCVISGKVTFSDGKGSSWYIDQLGRLGLNPDEEEYSPSKEDLEVFQIELRNVLSKEGL